jgi:hypothetical protein
MWPNGCLIWLALVSHCTAGHKPFTVETATSIAGASWDLLAILIISLAGGLVNLRQLAVLWSMTSGCQVKVLSAAVLIIGAVLVPSWLLVGLVVSGYFCSESVGWWRSWVSRLPAARGSIGQDMAVLSGFAVCSLTIALAPPVNLMPNLPLAILRLNCWREVVYQPGTSSGDAAARPNGLCLEYAAGRRSRCTCLGGSRHHAWRQYWSGPGRFGSQPDGSPWQPCWQAYNRCRVGLGLCGVVLYYTGSLLSRLQ